MDYKFLNALEASPVITAVKDDEGVDACLILAESPVALDIDFQ